MIYTVDKVNHFKPLIPYFESDPNILLMGEVYPYSEQFILPKASLLCWRSRSANKIIWTMRELYSAKIPDHENKILYWRENIVGWSAALSDVRDSTIEDALEYLEPHPEYLEMILFNLNLFR